MVVRLIMYTAVSHISTQNYYSTLAALGLATKHSLTYDNFPGGRCISVFNFVDKIIKGVLDTLRVPLKLFGVVLKLCRLSGIFFTTFYAS